MKQFYQFLFIVGVSQLALTCLHAQINQWTWVGGNKLTEQSGKYGTKGVASPNNYPGSRSGSISFSDKNGNFWLFGGTGIDANGNSGLLNDLWKWDGTSWTWVTGNNTINQNGTHITRGTPDPRNVPGSRQLGAGGVDKNGNVWIFGGEGLFDTTQVNVFSNPAMNLNDLWKWDGTNWTWLKGGNNGYSDKEPGGSFYYYGIYGTQGVPTATNYPGVRKNCVSWTDTNGNLWLYGGDGSADSAYYPTGSSGALADLWKWDGTYWTWINGSRRANVSAFYGIKGTGSAFNSPGGRREGSTGWTDANGNFWLFGGYTYNQASPFKMINDLWKWDGITWTWVSGSDTASQPGNYGTKGVSSTATVPGARSFGNGWADNAGNFWIFGGICAYPNIYGTLNDLWKFDGTRWTWMKGSDSVYQPANFGTKGITSANNTPGSRWKAMNYTDKNGKLLLFGGSGPYNTSFYSQFNNLNDLWIWDGNNWTWLNGTDSTGINEVPVYGTRGVAAASNRPGARANSVCWTDSKGNFWLFGGETLISPYAYYNDLWKWDGTNWTWVSGTNQKNQVGNFGAKGVSAATNLPGARSGSAGWADKNDNFWLFGGYGPDTICCVPNTVYNSCLNDLWKWDGTNWTFVHGRKRDNYNAQFGIQGVPDTANLPPSRTNGVSWTDKQGNFWLFGGNVYEGGLGVNNFGDLWKWNGTAWAWIKGGYNEINKVGVYGTKGIPDTANRPGSRDGSVVWKDSSDNVWLFGGRFGYALAPHVTGSPGYNNDLWKWDGNSWTWISGSNKPNSRTANYGIKGVPDAANLPGERYEGTSWVGSNGNLWLFGGYGADANGTYSYLNDLWVWDGKNWTWMNGNNTANQFSNYGTKGVAASSNTPGARYRPLSWKDNTGNLWLYGGQGIVYGSLPNISYSYYGYFNDLWKFSYGIVTAVNPAPNTPTYHSSILLLSNPSKSDQFRFASDRFYKKLHWQILDVSGRLLQEGNLQMVLRGSEQTVQTKHYTPGIYFIKFLGEDKEMQTCTFIKQ